MELKVEEKGAEVWDGGNCLGKLNGQMVHPGLFIIFYVQIKTDIISEQRQQVRELLIKWAKPTQKSCFGDERVMALSWVEESSKEYETILRESGFTCDMEKLYVKRELKGYCSSHTAPFTYVSVQDLSKDTLCSILDLVHQNNPAEGVDSMPVEKHFSEVLANWKEPWARKWQYAVFNKEPVGIVLPDLFSDEPGLGTLKHIGICPAYRGRGWGKILHAHGLEILANEGATEYIGSTHVDNVAMIRIFMANGCQKRGIRRSWNCPK